MSATGGSGASKRNWIPVVAVMVIAGLVGILVWSQHTGSQPLPDRQAAVRHLEEAKRLSSGGNIGQAVAALAQAKASDPTWAEPYLASADILLRSAQLREARNEILAAQRLAPDDPAVLHALMHNSSLMSAAEQEAIAQKAIVASPMDAEGWQFLGTAILSSGDRKRYPEAKKAFENALERAPSAYGPMISIAKLEMQTGENADAALILEHVAETMDTHAVQPMQFITLKDWAETRRTVAFWLEQIYAQTGQTAKSRSQSSVAAIWSARSAELRSLNDRNNASPPDMKARSRLEQIVRTGRFD